MSGIKNKVQPGDGDPRHGKSSTYTNHKCRCELCQAAWAEYCDARRKQRSLTPDDPRHGNVNTYYNWACRCDLCRRANTERARERRSAVA